MGSRSKWGRLSLLEAARRVEGGRDRLAKACHMAAVLHTMKIDIIAGPHNKNILQHVARFDEL